jgi:hypothetical protein
MAAIANRNCFCFIIIRDFIWEGKVNQIKRDVCCLDIENGGMSMVNLDSYIDSRRIKFIYRIINEPKSTI